MQIGRHDDPEASARVDVDVGKDAPLADQPQPAEALEQRCPDLRALTDEYERFAVAEALRQNVDILDMVVPHRDVMIRELREAVERSEGVEVVVEDRDLHQRARAATWPS